MSSSHTIQVYRGAGLIQPWRYRVVSANGQIVSVPGEGYFSPWNAKRAARKLHPYAAVVRLKGPAAEAAKRESA